MTDAKTSKDVREVELPPARAAWAAMHGGRTWSAWRAANVVPGHTLRQSVLDDASPETYARDVAAMVLESLHGGRVLDVYEEDGAVPTAYVTPALASSSGGLDVVSRENVLRDRARARLPEPPVRVGGRVTMHHVIRGELGLPSVLAGAGAEPQIGAERRSPVPHVTSHEARTSLGAERATMELPFPPASPYQLVLPGVAAPPARSASRGPRYRLVVGAGQTLASGSWAEVMAEAERTMAQWRPRDGARLRLVDGYETVREWSYAGAWALVGGGR